MAIDVLGALIVIDLSVAAVTVRVKLFEVIPLCVATITLDPALRPVLTPPEARLATAALEELQVAELVKSWVVPSLKMPIAVN